MVESAPLLREYTPKGYPGFESLPIRQFSLSELHLRTPIVRHILVSSSGAGEGGGAEQWHEWRIAGRSTRHLGRRTPRFDRFLEAGDHFGMSFRQLFGFVWIFAHVIETYGLLVPVVKFSPLGQILAGITNQQFPVVFDAPDILQRFVRVLGTHVVR